MIQSDEELDFSEDSSDEDEGDEGEEPGSTQQRTPGGGKVRGQSEYVNQGWGTSGLAIY